MNRRKYTNISPENSKVMERYIDYRLNSMKRSPKTVKLDNHVLRSLAHFLNEKPFKETTKEDLQDFFKGITRHSTHDTIGARFLPFFRWLFDLDKKEIPPMMKWFEFTPKHVKDRLEDPNKKQKHFITRDDYQKILNACYNNSERALWETYYISGGRREEILNMKIGDVHIHNGKVEITLQKSKTKPRNVPLSEPSPYLTELLDTHPDKDNPSAPLWLSFSARNFGSPININSVNQRLNRAVRRAGINRHLTPHDFRRTRATIYFSDVDDNQYHRWDEKEIGMIFGWTLQTVVLRKAEYDLTGYDSLKEKIFKRSGEVKTYTDLQSENKQLKSTRDGEVKELKMIVEMIGSMWYQTLNDEDKKKYDHDELLVSYLFGGNPRNTP